MPIIIPQFWIGHPLWVVTILWTRTWGDIVQIINSSPQMVAYRLLSLPNNSNLLWLKSCCAAVIYRIKYLHEYPSQFCFVKTSKILKLITQKKRGFVEQVCQVFELCV